MQSHTIDGAELLRKTEHFLVVGYDENDLRVAVEIALYHHEKYDGSGYPDGLKGEEIPISARIVSIADVYDALRSPRSYKKAFSHEEVVRIISIGDGWTDCHHFDPKVLEAFLTIEKKLLKFTSNLFDEMSNQLEACIG